MGRRGRAATPVHLVAGSLRLRGGSGQPEQGEKDFESLVQAAVQRPDSVSRQGLVVHA